MNTPELKYLPFIWLSLVITIIILGLIRITEPDYEVVSLLGVFIHSIIVLLILVTVPQTIKNILIWAFLARLLFLIWDTYARHIFILPNAGGDVGMYYGAAIKISENINLLNEPTRAGIFGKIMGTLFFIIGPQRMFAQYINVIVGLFVVITIYKMMNLLDISPVIQKTVLLIAAFFPNSLIMSAIFLREIIPTFLVSLSLYYFLLWYKNQALSNIIFSITILAFAAVFHSGVIGIFVGYAFFFLFYKKENNKFRFSTQTIVAFVVVGGLAYFTSTQFGDVMFGKFKGAEEMEDIYTQANSRLGESAYLTGMTINNPVQFMLYGPIKTFYFLTAPLPMNWRGGMDIFSFFFDSLIYFITLWVIWKNWWSFRYKKPLIIGLLLTLVGVAFIFGIGVSNAGTAIRHRQKIIPLILILLAVMTDEKQRSKMESIKAIPHNIF
jgi:hypothetical protein